jgi:hypothetical protein
MQMNPSQNADGLSERDQGKDHRDNSTVDAARELCSNESNALCNPSEPSVPDARAMQTFADGSGI